MARTEVRSVYVHAPFCARRCTYCDFAVQVRRVGDALEWVEALRGELAGVRAEGVFTLADSLDTLYVGGGTPSLLGPEAMGLLADVLGRDRVTGAELEWTAEANPESVTPELAAGWRAVGVNRLSLGVQSFSQDVLRWMGRLHGPDGSVQAVTAAKAAGFENVSVDLMFGLPEHLGRSWRDDLDRTLALDVPHVSLYGLTVEPATSLGRAVAEGRERPVDEDRYGDEFLLAAEVLTAAGYEHYEVSSFARTGARSRHNAVYWLGAPYLGLGNGAHSYAHPLRRWNQRAWDAYREVALRGRVPTSGQERIDESEHRLERAWLELRTSEGTARSGIGGRMSEVVAEWEREGLASLSEARVRLTAQGWLLLDRLAVELDDARSA